ncbi:hypothetical protein [Mesorhizobium sp. dw_380]|uniref:hypothetical protein n=1 Tax=Mesorhizobium sp. dw_380 TaxID=2812001 RepID=UPI001BDF6493|nr:hypothetical protein [Mesorhizobium sp. dw_380]
MLVNERYSSELPSKQAAIDVFAGRWTSGFPKESGLSSGGVVPLFEDPRIAYLVTKLGASIVGVNAVELGPLEGGHSYSLIRAGVGSLLAIEGNSFCYLKTLITKEVLDLKNLHVEYGEVEKWLDKSDERFELIVASGILYHFVDPLRALVNMTNRSETIFLWTHFFDEEYMPQGDRRRVPFSGRVTTAEYNGYTAKYYWRSYLGAQTTDLFNGGVHDTSVWMSRDGILETLSRAGFSVEESFVAGDHVNGPSACFLARRR